MNPVILITMDEDVREDRYILRRDYCRRIAAAGGLPLLVPHITLFDANAMLDTASAIILTGGGDAKSTLYGEVEEIPPRDYSPERDTAELALIRAAYARKKPIFGICRGMQMLNIALGGTLHQQLPPSDVNHAQTASRYTATHRVNVTHSRLAGIIGEQPLVNSTHHQGIKTLSSRLSVAAKADDGVVEAVISVDTARFMLGVQWHPECLDEMQSLFDTFVTTVNGASIL